MIEVNDTFLAVLTERVSEALSERYGLRLHKLSQLGGELDLNFRAEIHAQAPVFVRLTPAPCDAAAIRWQDLVLQQLENSPISVDTPRLLSQRDGSRGSAIEVGPHARFHLRVTTWLEGAGVSGFGEADRTFRHQLGYVAGEVVERLSALNELGSTDNPHHWMVTRSGASLRTTMGSVTDPAQAEMIRTALRWFDGVAPQLEGLPRSVVHQDLHDFNLLAQRDEHHQMRLTGVVDFNDAVFTVRVAELAVAAAYAALRQPAPFEAFAEVVEGYLSAWDLTDAEVDVVYPLGVARLAVNASTWTQLSRGPNAAYARARMAATWPALRHLLRHDPEAAGARFRAIRSR